MTKAERGYPDFHDHLAALESAGLLVRVSRVINKDTEMHPLVRWQFRGGIPEDERKAFLFENVVDSSGRHYDMSVAVGALATNPRMYAIGMGCRVEEIGERWRKARLAPIPPLEVTDAPCQEVVYTRDSLLRPGGGVDSLPVPISTPGWENAPYLTCAMVITKDPDTGIQNIGNYRSMLKAPNRVGINPSIEQKPGMHQHWLKCRERGIPLPCAIAVGGPAAVAFAAAVKLPYDVDELAVAGALVGAPLNVVRAKTVDLLVPAEAEIIIEGLISTESLEPEGPFGEAHGYMNLMELNPFMDVTGMTRREDAILVSMISQVPPSEGTVIRKVAYEPQLKNHLCNVLGIQSVVGVGFHEPLTDLNKLIVIQMKDPLEREIWQALYAVASYLPAWGKIVVAVDPDIDPHNADAIFWAMCYRMRPHVDMQIMRGKDLGHVPRWAGSESSNRMAATDSAMLINAVLKEKYPPVCLPKQEYMEGAREIWKELGFPELKPEAPWFGYSLGLWPALNAAQAERATRGEWLANGEWCLQRRVPAGEPNTDIMPSE